MTLRSRLLFIVAPCALLALMLAGCGIAFSGEGDETEVFKRLEVVGPLVPGAELRMGLNYEQPYNTDVQVQCDLLTAARAAPTPEPTENPRGTATPTPIVIPAPEPTPANRITVILQENIGPNVDGTIAGESTPVPGSISRRFTAPAAPGEYVVHCYTPFDDNNQIRKSIRIAEGVATTVD